MEGNMRYLDSSFLYHYISDCSLERIRDCLAKGMNPNQQDRFEETPLHKAGFTYGNNIGIIKELINAGADVNSVNKLGFTPLHYAVMHGKQEMVKVLLQFGADINARTSSGNTALHLAFNCYRLQNIYRNGFRDRLVPNNGNESNSYDKYPLHSFGIPKASMYMPYLLLRHGASVCTVNELNQSPIDILIDLISSDQSLRIAKQFIKMVVFENNISEKFKRNIERHPELSRLLETCGAEVERMRNEILSGNLTIHDFLLDCFNEDQFENVLLDIYKPAVDILMTGCYSAYFHDILFRFEKFELLRVLRYNLYLRNITEDFRDPQTMKFLRIYNNCVLSNYVSHWELFRLILSHSDLADNEIKNINALEI